MRLIYNKKGKGKNGEFGAAILLFAFFIGAYAVGASFTQEELDTNYAANTSFPAKNSTSADDSTADDVNTSVDVPEEEEESADCGAASSGVTVLDPAECAAGTPVWQCDPIDPSEGTQDYFEDFPFDRVVEVADDVGANDVTVDVTISSPVYADTTGIVSPSTLVAYDEVEQDTDDEGNVTVERQYTVDDSGNRTLVNTVTYDSDGNPDDADEIQLENWNESWGAAEIAYWTVKYENTSTTNYYRANPYDTSYVSRISISSTATDVMLPVSADAMIDLYNQGVGATYASIGGLWFVELALQLEAAADSFDSDSDEEFEYDEDAVPEVDATTAAIVQAAIGNFSDGSALYNTYVNDEDFLREFEGDVAELMYIVPPGQSRTYLVATYIPLSGTQNIGHIGVEMDNTLDRSEIFDDGESTNPVVFTTLLNPTALDCEATDSTPYTDLNTGPAYTAALRSSSGGIQLERAPMQGPLTVVRGFGCSAVFTGVRSASCSGATPWFHNGIDFVAPKGTDYYDVLPDGGEVIYAGRWRSPYPNCSFLISSAFPHEGLGYYIKHWGLIDGIPVVVWGGHLSGFNVQTSQDVFPGQILGETGTSGCSSGPHLHFAVEVNGLFVNPAFLLPS